MGRARGVNAGGGQSSLGYLFGGGDEAPKPAAENPESVENMPQSPADKANKAAAGIRGGGCCQTNNYFRSEGQNCGNFFGGGDEAPKPAAANPESVENMPQSPADNANKAAAGIRGGGCCQTNNYFRSEGQNCGNFFGGGDEAPSPAAANPESVENMPQSPADKANKAAAGIRGGGCCQTNNYFRSEGQNYGNFLTDRPLTKVHAAPGGNSSLGYLFGGSGTGSKSNP